jgi:hypothetical protein
MIRARLRGPSVPVHGDQSQAKDGAGPGTVRSMTAVFNASAIPSGFRISAMSLPQQALRYPASSLSDLAIRSDQRERAIERTLAAGPRCRGANTPWTAGYLAGRTS